MNKHVAAVLVIALMSAATAFATQTPVDISAQANAPWCGEPYHGISCNCSALPSGAQTYDGVAFQIPTVNNAWFADVAALGQSGEASVTIPVNVKNIKTVYTLMNTQWGSTQSGLLSITFTGTGKATWTYNLVGGTDIRDYCNDGTTNSIDCGLPNTITKTAGSAGTVGAFNSGEGQRLDMQIFELPKSFASKTLVSITITDNGAPGLQRSFLAALTVSTNVP